jgi:pyruvate/2-oxoglutarate dehydrogenase complex dihydrolipoamide dehydrogenase (E3) component
MGAANVDSPVRIVVLGAGPGGYVAALRAARHGAQVTLVERDLIGGTCLNRGCIPTKALLACSEALAKARSGAEYGFEVSGAIRPDLSRMMARKDRVVTTLRESVETLLRRAKVEVIRGSGKLSSPSTVSVETSEGVRTVEADKIIIATGSEPALLPMFDFSHPAVLTSTSALALEKIPESLLIVGAGVIGCELAAFFAELGAKNLLCVSSDPDMAATTAKFQAMVDAASGTGVRVNLEFGLFTEVKTIHMARAVLEAVEGEAKALLVDTLHWARSGGTAEDLAAIPQEWLSYCQPCDAPAQGPDPASFDAIIDDAINRRMPLGQGGLPLAAMVEQLIGTLQR